MGQFEKNIYSIKELGRIIHTGEGIAVYGVGDYGKKLIDYLIYIKENKRIKGIIVTDRVGLEPDYKGIAIEEASDFFAKDCECHVIIAVSGVYQEEIVKIVQRYDRQYRSMTHDLYSDMDKEMNPCFVPYQGIDFLCPGFGKCGTSSLYSALKTMDSIYLSEWKENHFFAWCDDVENPEEILIETFFDGIKKGQKVGMIEPSYAWEAKKTYELLGDEVKIIFVVRNPVDGAFSRFKMAARQGWEELDMAYQRHGGKFSVEIFEERLQRFADGYKYIDWIEQFEKYYTKKQIKVVFLEELIKRPQEILNSILDFIGVLERYEQEELPLINEGSFVMADVEGLKLGRLRRQKTRSSDRGLSLQEVRKRKYERKSERSEIQEKYNQATKIYGVKMTAELRKKAEAYLNSSVRRLEAWLNKDLSKIWF